MNNPSGRGVRVNAWLRLFRVSILPTVPGDPIAGYLLSASIAGVGISGRLVLPVLVSLLIYCAGLLGNDYFDIEEDRRFRPSRPLPAGLLASRTVLIVAILLTIDAVFLAWSGGIALGTMSTLLSALAWGYNAGVKKLAVVSPVVMGSCRGLGLLLGAAIVVGFHLPLVLVVSSFGLIAYVAAVTIVSVGETSKDRIAQQAWLPIIAMLAWMGTVFFFATRLVSFNLIGDWAGLPILALPIIIAGIVLRWGFRLQKGSAPALKQQAIGSWLRALILMQSWLVWWGFALSASQQYVYLAFAIALILAWPVSVILARRFPPT